MAHYKQQYSYFKLQLSLACSAPCFKNDSKYTILQGSGHHQPPNTSKDTAGLKPTQLRINH